MSLVSLYIQYVHAEIVVYVVQIFFVFDTRVHVLYTYFFSHMFIIQNKKKEKHKTVLDL